MHFSVGKVSGERRVITVSPDTVAAGSANVTFADLNGNANARVATAIASANIPQASRIGRTAVGASREDTSFAIGASQFREVHRPGS